MTTIWLGYINPPDGLWPVGSVLKFGRQRIEEVFYPLAFLNEFEGSSIDPGCALVGFTFCPGIVKNIQAINLVVEAVESEFFFLFGFNIEFALKVRTFSNSCASLGNQVILLHANIDEVVPLFSGGLCCPVTHR